MAKKVESITLIKQNHEVIKELKHDLHIANDKISIMKKRHTRVVAKLHEHIDNYRKKMIGCLNTSVPDMSDDICI